MRTSAGVSRGVSRGGPVVLRVGMWGAVGWFMVGCLVVSSVMVGLVGWVQWWGLESVWGRGLGWGAVVCWVAVVGSVVGMSRERLRELGESD